MYMRTGNNLQNSIVRVTYNMTAASSAICAIWRSMMQMCSKSNEHGGSQHFPSCHCLRNALHRDAVDAQGRNRSARLSTRAQRSAAGVVMGVLMCWRYYAKSESTACKTLCVLACAQADVCLCLD